MIVSNIIGGLGNQMFQHAAGRALSLKHQVPLLLDTRSFKSYKLHQGFELSRIFQGEITIATDDYLKNMLGIYYYPIANKIDFPLKKYFAKRHNIFIEPKFNYWADFNRLPNIAYLNGYWQSEKYFKDYEQCIRSDFSFKYELDVKNKQLLEKIQNNNTVSIHIRRGDYLSNSSASEIHGVCSIEYYRSAVMEIKSHIEKPFFVIFSDDLEWVKNNIKYFEMDSFVFCEYNKGSESYKDMQMMSLCQHHIIANSTFSWWGAWLNNNPSKIVIAPQKWFADEVKQSQAFDIYPNEWIKL
jgi:hypothetical protein